MDIGAIFRDYWAPIATAIAAFSAIVSLIRTEYLTDYPRLKKLIVAGLIILAIVSVCGTFYSQYQIVSFAKAEKMRHTKIREGIGKYIGEGTKIMDRFGSNEMPMPTLDEVGWIGRTEDFLRSNLGKSYVSRFNDVSGHGSVTAPGTDGPHNAYYNSIYSKITRLEEFSHELP